MPEAKPATVSSYILSPESIADFLEFQQQNGVSGKLLRQRKGFVTGLYDWLPEDKMLSGERLRLWRTFLEQKGYTQQTILSYVKGINLYLDFMGWSEIRFNRGRAKDIRNITFGYLTAMEPTGEKHRRDIVWRCQCKCGNLMELPAARLLSGNTLSCGCMKADNIRTASKTIAGTQLVQSLKEDAARVDTRSGYPGVAPRGSKWYAHITYRGKRYNLGTYSNIEDAVKARARAKELVMEDAQQLLELFETLHCNDRKPDRAALPKVQPAALPDTKKKTPFLTVTRNNNKSGYPGVCVKRNKWKAYISYQGEKFSLGYFEEKEAAIAARRMAEHRLMEDPESFVSSQKAKGVLV